MKTTTRASRRQFFLHAMLAVATIGLVPSVARAYDERSTQSINVDAQGLALRGHDPVAFFEVGKPMPGQANLTATHEGATYRFANEHHRLAFQQSPQKYIPAFGGFCAMGVALGKKLDVDLNAWRIVDGRLYLNLNKDVQKRWESDVPGNLKQANDEWPRLKHAAPKDL
jgi:YHS domain-containing protein